RARRTMGATLHRLRACRPPDPINTRLAAPRRPDAGRQHREGPKLRRADPGGEFDDDRGGVRAGPDRERARLRGPGRDGDRERSGFGLGGRALSVFVERERELEALRERFEEVERGQGHVVAVVGEPGVGKSRFVYELTRSDHVRGWRILRCGAVSYGITTPSL